MGKILMMIFMFSVTYSCNDQIEKEESRESLVQKRGQKAIENKKNNFNSSQSQEQQIKEDKL